MILLELFLDMILLELFLDMHVCDTFRKLELYFSFIYISKLFIIAGQPL